MTNKFEKFISDIFSRLDNIDKVLKEKPPKISKKSETPEFKLLQEHHDKKFDELRTEFKALKDELKEPRKQIEQGNFNLMDFLFKP